MFLDVKGSVAALQNGSRHHLEVSGRLGDDKQSIGSCGAGCCLNLLNVSIFSVTLKTQSRMEEIKSHKKRKRPFNWDDIYQSSSEDERQIIKKRVSRKEYNNLMKI